MTVIDQTETGFAERIQHMRERQRARLARDQEEAARREEIRQAPARLLGEVYNAVAACAGLRLRDGQTGATDMATVGVWPSNKPPTLSLKGAKGNLPDLITFVVEGDLSAGEVYLTHDGDRVTVD